MDIHSTFTEDESSALTVSCVLCFSVNMNSPSAIASNMLGFPRGCEQCISAMFRDFHVEPCTVAVALSMEASS